MNLVGTDKPGFSFRPRGACNPEAPAEAFQVALLLFGEVAAHQPVRRSGSTTASDRKSTRLNSSHLVISYAVFCLKKKKKTETDTRPTPNATRRHSRSQLVTPCSTRCDITPEQSPHRLRTRQA